MKSEDIRSEMAQNGEAKMTFDEILARVTELLQHEGRVAYRVQAAREGTTQKTIVIDALEAYFAHQLESSFLLKAAKEVFQEWDNDDDQGYDTL